MHARVAKIVSFDFLTYFFFSYILKNVWMSISLAVKALGQFLF